MSGGRLLGPLARDEGAFFLPPKRGCQWATSRVTADVTVNCVTVTDEAGWGEKASWGIRVRHQL
jgi:hypothetical protein